MKICIVTRNLLRGGAESVISHLTKYMVSNGNEVSLILIDDRPILQDIPSKCQIDVIGQKAQGGLKDKILRYKAVRRLIMEKQCDVVLSMPEEIGIYVLAAMIGTGIPVVVSERNNPWVMPNKKVTRVLRKLLYPFADGLIFQTEYASTYFSKRLRKKSIVIPNPLDVERLPDVYNGVRDKVIAGAGRLEPQKNFKLLIDAFSLFQANHLDYKLVIYGEGRLRDELENYAAERIEQGTFSFPGNVLDLPQRLSRVSAFVLSSDFEGMPNVLIEAMAMGIPCVSTDCPSGGPKELIEDGVNGYLVPVGDSVALANRLEKLVSGSEIMADAQQIRNRFDCNKVAKQWQEYLEKVVNGR